MRFFHKAYRSVTVKIFVTVFTLASVCSAKGQFDVRDYGAVGDGTTLDTKAIQTAIDRCREAGGGKVYLNNGRFLSGTIYLKSNVTLYLEAGAVLLGSTKIEDYPVTISSYRSFTDNLTDKSLIYAEKAENIAIIGRGVIDGQGASFKGQWKARPFTMRIIECSNVTVRDLTIRNSAMWVQHYLACDDVTINGITVHSHVAGNNDGIDIDSCYNVRISNCNIDTGDDAIVLKSTSNRACRNVTITNCVLSSRCNAFKCGTDSNGGFEDITVSNCSIYNTNLAGIALEVVDGGTMERVIVSNITMKDVRGGIFIRLGNRARPVTAKASSETNYIVEKGIERPPIGSLQNITISNVEASGVDRIGCSITGLPGHPVENVTLRNIRIEYTGGGLEMHATKLVGEQAGKYPEYTMFGTLPAYGFYCRHARNVKFQHLDLSYEEKELRPALFCEDVKNLDIFNLDAESEPSAKALIWLKDVDGGFIHGCNLDHQIKSFVRVQGRGSDNITLMNNNTGKAGKFLEKSKEVKKKAVYLSNNKTR